MALVGQVTHVRCKVMYRCVCPRNCEVETDTQQGYQQRKLETNLGSYSVPTQLMSLSHDDSHAITPYLGNKVSNLRLTHIQCSQFAWSGNQGRVTSSHAADSVAFAERVQEIPSPDHRKGYTRVVNTVLRYSNVLHLHQHVCHEIGDTMVRTSRFTLLKCFLPATHLTIWSFARRPQFFVVGRTVTNLSLSFASVQHVLFSSHSPLCFLQNLL